MGSHFRQYILLDNNGKRLPNGFPIEEESLRKIFLPRLDDWE